MVVGGFALIAGFTEPESTSRTVGLVAMMGALIALWLFQLWDAAFRP